MSKLKARWSKEHHEYIVEKYGRKKGVIKMEKNINVNLEGNELTVLSGVAKSPVENKSFRFYGDIKSTAEYLIKNNPEAENTIVLFNYDSATILCHLNYKTNLDSSIQGDLEENEKLKQFSINTGQSFTMNELVKLIRFSRNLFKNKDNSMILSKLEEFEHEVRLSYKQKDDFKGNFEKNLKREKTGGVNLSFILETEFYKGEDKINFNVEIITEQLDSGVRFYFESLELMEIKEELLEKIFDRELKKIDPKYTIIRKY